MVISRGRSLRLLASSLLGLVALGLVGCGGGGGGGGFPPATPTPDPVFGPGDKLPGVNIEVRDIRGALSPDGYFAPGDTITVEFAIKRDDGLPLELVDMDRGAIMVSGPTFHYQRVIASQGDVLDRAVRVGVGLYTYTFETPIPATYLAPINDTPAITDGEWTGEPLVDGTYTIGIEIRKDYDVDSETLRDPGNTVAHFLIGSSATMETRELVRAENCFQCHNEVRAHGDNRTDLNGCLLCHTAGAEDKNEPSVANGTPGVTIDFRVMIHKIHSGHALPSVNGVTTNPDGSRKYDAPKQPYQVMGYRNSLHDYSELAMPLWPSVYAPMPRDVGYGDLSGAEQDLEDTMRGGMVLLRQLPRGPGRCRPRARPGTGSPRLHAADARCLCELPRRLGARAALPRQRHHDARAARRLGLRQLPQGERHASRRA